jgi:hypothetical protein
MIAPIEIIYDGLKSATSGLAAADMSLATTTPTTTTTTTTTTSLLPRMSLCAFLATGSPTIILVGTSVIFDRVEYS